MILPTSRAWARSHLTGLYFTTSQDIRLSKAKPDVIVEFDGCGVATLASEKQEYKVLSIKGELVATVDFKRAVGLGLRKLVTCRATEVEVDGQKRYTLRCLVMAPKVIASQIRNVVKLKPPAMSICNKATVVKIMPTTYTHRSSLMAGF